MIYKTMKPLLGSLQHTRIESRMSEISDEEVDYGSFESSVNPSADSDHQWSTSENDIIVKFAV